MGVLNAAEIAAGDGVAVVDATMVNLDVAVWVTDTNDKVVATIPPAGLTTDVPDGVALSAIQADVTATRGSRASMAARATETLTPYGAPRAPSFNTETLRNTRLKLAQLSAGESVRFVANLGQDSFTQVPTGWARKFATRMFSRFADGGAGWIGFGGIGANPNDNIRAAYTVALSGFLRNQSLAVFSTHSPDCGFAHSSTSGHTITAHMAATPVHSGIDLYFEKTTAGALSVSVDGGGAQAVDCSGSGLGKVALTGIPGSGAYDIVITNAGNNEVRVCGLYAVSAASGIMLNKIAAAGSIITTWTGQNSTSRALWMGALTADLWVWMGGPNEQGGAIAAATYAASVGSWVDTIRTYQPEADILLAVPAENSRVNTVTMASYQEAIAEVAWQKTVAFRSFQKSFGRAPANYNNANAYLKLEQSDLLHPTALGDTIITDAFSRDIIPPFTG